MNATATSNATTTALLTGGLVVLAAGAAAATSGCSGTSDTAAVVSDGPVVRLVEDLRIGRAADELQDGPDVFGEIMAVAVDDAGRTYVADHQSSDVRVFDSEGDFVRRIGRKGSGPGEFRFLSGALWQQDVGSRTGGGILWAMDAARHRLLAFDSAGKLLNENRLGDFTFASIP